MEVYGPVRRCTRPSGKGRRPDAFGTLYHRYLGPLAHKVFRVVREDAAADDICQEAFIRAWKRIDQLASGASVVDLPYRDQPCTEPRADGQTEAGATARGTPQVGRGRAECTGVVDRPYNRCP